MTSPRKKKLAAKKTPQQGRKAKQKKVKKSALTAPVKRNWNVPALFFMLIIIAIPVIGASALMQGHAPVMRLSFLLPVVPLLLILIGYKKSAISISMQPVALALWGMVLLGLITSIWAVNSFGAINGVLKWFYVLLMSIAVYSLARDDTDTHHKIMLACALAGGYMALVGVTQYLFGHEFYITPIGQYPWPSATSGHKNMASQFVIVTLPFALYLGLMAKKPFYWLANPLVALMLAYLVYGRARQAFVALFVQFLVLLVAVSFRQSRRLFIPSSRSKDYYFSIIASLALLAALVIAPPFNKPFSWEKSAVSEFAERTEVFTQDDATLQEMSNGRLATWMITADMIRNHPAGVGLNNWKVEYPKYNAESIDYYRSQKRDIWGDAHNDYLQLMAELGLPFLLLGGLMIFGLWKVYRLIWTKGDETSKRNSLFIGMGIAALFTVMMFSFPLTMTATPICLGIYLGLLSAMASIPLSSKPEKRLAFNPIVFTILLLLLVAGATFGYREVTAWHQSSIARVISQSIFQPADNNPYLNRANMLMLAKHTDEAMDLEPYAPILLRESILAYTNLSLKIDHERLSEKYRKQALETALRHLGMSPNEIFIHMIVATRLQVPNEQAIEHIGKAIALNPDDLQLYEDLKSIALPTRQFDKMLSYYEYYIPRFYNQKMNEEYVYLGRQDNQQERVINVLGSIDLTRRFTPGSSEYNAAEKSLKQLIESLKRNL